MTRPDYCPIGGEPCQSLCETPCGQAPSLTGPQASQVLGALVRARDGFASEAATGQPVLHSWRDETVRKLQVAIDTMQRLRAQQRVTKG